MYLYSGGGSFALDGRGRCVFLGLILPAISPDVDRRTLTNLGTVYPARAGGYTC